MGMMGMMGMGRPPSAGSHLAFLLRSFSLTLIDALDTLLVSMSQAHSLLKAPACHLYTWI